MKRILLLFLFFTVAFTTTNAQSLSEAKSVVEDFCDLHFKDCFGWTYIKVVSIDDIKPLSDDQYLIKGVVKNTGYFGTTHNRDFKATVTKLSSGKKRVAFNKQAINAGVETWEECVKVVR